MPGLHWYVGFYNIGHADKALEAREVADGSELMKLGLADESPMLTLSRDDRTGRLLVHTTHAMTIRPKSSNTCEIEILPEGQW